MTVSIIVTTYNMPEWLEKTLWGYARQAVQDFEIVIADDGSGADTAAVIERMRRETGMTITHVWHEDQGFRKTLILNKAIMVARGEYLLFTDGDCIPREDVIATHCAYARPGVFLSGGYYKLPFSVSQAIDKDAIMSGDVFSARWLLQAGCRWNPKLLRLTLPTPLAGLCQAFTTTKASFNGCNSSAWKSDIVRVNGFDERMGYGAEDREFGARLVNAGIRPRMVRYLAPMLHLDHSRSYRRPEVLKANREIWMTTVRQKHTRTQYGIMTESDMPGASPIM